MKDVVKAVGVFVVCAILFTNPMWAAVSICMHWNGFVSLVLVVSCIIEFICFLMFVSEEVKE